MKFTIMGFSQEKLKELDLDLTDSLIIRWFVDFKDSGNMASEILENDKYYWIKYEYLLEEIPIININNKKTLGRRLKTLSEKGVLKQFIKRKGGIFTLYTLGEKYKLLISNNLVTQKSQGYTLKSNKGSDSKVTTKDSSIKEINLLKDSYTKDIYTDVYNYYLSKSNLIKHKNFTNDMKKAIDRAMKELKLDLDYFKRIIDRHSEKVEATKNNGQFKVKTRTIQELFGQKKKDSVSLICSDYLDEVHEHKKIENNKNKTKEQIEKESLEKYGF